MTGSGLAAPRHSMLRAVGDRLTVGVLRTHAVSMARAHGLDADTVERAGVIAGEMAANIVHHARTGHVVLRAIGEHASGGIEILGLDKGPGIADMARAMRDADSPAQRRDGGYAGIRRLANLFDIYSQRGKGTAVVAQVGGRSEAMPGCSDFAADGCTGVVCVPLRSEEECGDAWVVDTTPERLVALLVDGLGHGPGAAAAALAALAAFRDVAADTPENILAAMHGALRHTRGAALSVTVIDAARRTARFCGVGNVDGRIVTADGSRQQMPQSGIVGHTMPRLQSSELPWPAEGRLVMHSDGVSSRWRADAYPGLLARHPALLAGVLFRDFARERDDATVLVLRDPSSPGTA